jgi:hypothetical protein
MPHHQFKTLAMSGAENPWLHHERHLSFAGDLKQNPGVLIRC